MRTLFIKTLDDNWNGKIISLFG
ncbi:uncharacterized protein METZ01_LOCUS159164 [marine metagenome]|uniref:Uncharacterized protein n=1 Tax=marine metagenome TaxID=408172 RepID=A0A382AXN9_9ZZZZ